LAEASVSAKKDNKKHFTLYGGDVNLVFNPDSPRYRYVVDDHRAGVVGESVRGVTTVLRDILHKPDLMSYQMNESMKYLFGQKFDEKLKMYFYDPEVATLKPDTPVSKEGLQELLEHSRNAHNKRSDRGKDMGTMFHRVMELHLKRKDKVMAEVLKEFEPSAEDAKALKKMYESLVKWWEALNRAHDVIVIDIERPIYGRELNYAGTMDLCLEIDGRFVVLDLKTTNRSRKAPMGIYSEYFMQLGAYAYAYRMEHGYAIGDVGIVNIGKDGKLNAVLGSDMNVSVEWCEKAFAFACRLHDWLEVANKTLTENANVNSILNPLTEGREVGSES